MMKSHFGWSAGLLVLILSVTGCSTTEVVSVPDAFEVKKGMPVQDLLAGLGEPDQKAPYKEGVEGVELWIYSKERTDTKMVATDMEEVPFVDPVTGHESTETRAVMSPELTKSETKTIFLVANGVVEAWRVEEGSKSFL